MRGKDVYDGMMCIELMEIGTRGRTYGAFIAIEFTTGMVEAGVGWVEAGGKGGGGGGGGNG